METFTAREYLKIDIANNFGLDKKQWAERIQWFDQNEKNLDSLISKAKEPAQFYAGVLAWRDVQAGKPIGYTVGLDATASGMQILACLTSDPHAAQLCNVVDTGDRENAYTLVYYDMLEQIGDTAKVEAEQAKQAVMTSLYGSTAIPKLIFGEGQLLDVFHNSMKRLMPAVWELNQVLLDVWDPQAIEYNWVMPDNFHVVAAVEDTRTDVVHFLNKPYDVTYTVAAPTDKGRSLCANMTHSVDGFVNRELTARCNYDAGQVSALRRIVQVGKCRGMSSTRAKDATVIAIWNQFKQSGYLSARILNHLDEDNIGQIDVVELLHLLDSLPAKPFQIISVHDCFRCLPNYCNDLRRQYALILSQIAKSNMLSHLLTQIMGRSIAVGKVDPTMHTRIQNTNYALS